MAGVGEEEVEYESDPEEAKLSLTMRRREASDDEEDGEGDERERREKLPTRIDSRVGIGPGGELDGQGAAAEYDDEESEIEEEEEVEEYEEEEVEEVEGVEEEEEEYEERLSEDGVGASGEVEPVGVAAAEATNELDGERGRSVGESTEVQGVSQVEEEKKENEPFAVPTAGAFYMHDDRFRDNAGGRHRRTLGGRKLWESKDDRKWGHDKFEEMTSQERHYEEGRRTSRGHYRARGKNQGGDRGYQRGNRSKAYNNNQNHAPKAVRGRGPRRYEPSTTNNSKAPPTQNKQSGKSVEKFSHASSGRVPAPTSNVEPDPVYARKHVFASSLSSASPPFYPSGSSNKEISLTQKRDVQAGTINRNLRPSVMDESFSMSQSNAKLRGKDIADSLCSCWEAFNQLPIAAFWIFIDQYYSIFSIQGSGEGSTSHRADEFSTNNAS
uniref:Putative epsin n=1 Tax=Davidia involucrata TaxID=16924 RepID=A0A5B7A4T3_DAVIN